MELPTAKLLSWDEAAALAIVLVIVAVLMRRARSTKVCRAAPFAQEAGHVAALYSTWMLAGSMSKHNVSGAFDRARWIDQAERLLHLPAEQRLQLPLIEHQAWGTAANLYYGTVHLPSMGLLLFWLFWRHRERYARVRTLILVFTLLSTLIQMIAVAPPRLLPELGFVDIAARYHQSMYEFAGVAAQDLLAMPSVHVGWAVLIAGAVIMVGHRRRRWLILLHPVITIYVVTATGNHWWLDSVAAMGLIAVILGAYSAWHRFGRAWGHGRSESRLSDQKDAADSLPARTETDSRPARTDADSLPARTDADSLPARTEAVDVDATT